MTLIFKFKRKAKICEQISCYCLGVNIITHIEVNTCCISVTPHTQCRLKLLKQERIKDYLLMEEEFIRNQEQMKPLEEKQEVSFVALAPHTPQCW